MVKFPTPQAATNSSDGNQRQCITLGKEAQPLLIIDNAAPDPAALVAAAESGEPFCKTDDNFYPGHRKVAPPEYTQLLQAFAPDIAAVFGCQSATAPQLVVEASVFSLVTTPQRALRPIQCVPHVDSQDGNLLAVVHYLCDEKYDGTSFYRHRNTGYESITPERCKTYFHQLKGEMIQQGQAALQYMNGSTSLFDRVYRVPLKFNRLIIYRGNSLHAGDIDPALGLPLAPREGRLTINSFLSLS